MLHVTQGTVASWTSPYMQYCNIRIPTGALVLCTQQVANGSNLHAMQVATIIAIGLLQLAGIYCSRVLCW
jgi:hypothetical protein